MNWPKGVSYSVALNYAFVNHLFKIRGLIFLTVNVITVTKQSVTGY